MTRALSAHHPSRLLTARNQNAHDQIRQRRNQHRAPPKRSVSSLSATQLERKRANDREAQRLIRQRTKDRIDGLEQEIADLRDENERLHRCLRQRSIRGTEILHKRNNVEAGSASWNRSKITHVSPGHEAPSQDQSGSRFQLSHGLYSPVSPGSFPANPAMYPSHVAAPLDMNFSAYSWGVATTSSPTGDSVEECHVQYQRALPTPVYQHLLSPYQVQPMSPVALHGVLPNGQLHFLPPEAQSHDVMSKKMCNQAAWPL